MRILESLSWAEIGAALGAQAHGTPSGPPRGASIDTRTLEPGDAFFALKGERVDGHEHVAAAFKNGAVCTVVENTASVPRGAFALVVDDAERALFELGRLIRSRSHAVFVAITGSAGKTTAKEFTAALLEARGSVLATRGNLNNHLGVPLTLARLEVEHWAAVLECGMSHAGEISRLTHLIRPRVAAVTNVTAAHLEFFNSVAEIAAAKAEIFETLGPGDTAVAPANEPLLSDRALAVAGSVWLFGKGERPSIDATNVSMSLEGSDFELASPGSTVAISLPVPGPHAIANFLVASSIALALGIPVEDIAARARCLKAGRNRGAVKRLRDDILLIDDSYNSNPKALLSAVETLALAKDRRRVACIGDMLELGPSGPRLHREAGAAVAPHVDLLLGVGPLGAEIVAGAETLALDRKRAFGNSTDLALNIGALVQSRDAVLVKGSRGMRMERVVEALVTAHPEVGA
jgi:UDP-N-acetylmuramoyl-tripeptide--D-alanyl-D-alanine ligase